MARYVDLTHPIEPGMPVYPGGEPPLFTPVATLEDDGFLERSLTFSSHTGTHIDAPAHMIPGGRTLDELPLHAFFGSGCVVDARGANGESLGLELLARYREPIAAADFVLLHTGWATRWGTPGYLRGFPVLTSEAAGLLAACGLKGVGVDTISVDPVGASDFVVHHLLLGAGVLIVENLTRLDALPASGFELACAPLRIAGADGSPVRAVATLEG